MQSVRSIPPRRLPLLQPLVVLLLLLGLAAQCLGNVETSYVFELNAREEMCYYEDALGEPRIKLEFQVSAAVDLGVGARHLALRFDLCSTEGMSAWNESTVFGAGVTLGSFHFNRLNILLL